MKGVQFHKRGVEMSKRMNIEWREGEKELLELYKREQKVEIRSRLHAF